MVAPTIVAVAATEAIEVTVAPEPEQIHRLVQCVRKRGSPKLRDATDYQSGLSREQVEAAARGCHTIYLDDCCVGCSYHVSCGNDGCCLWSPSAVSFYLPCLLCWPLVAYCRDDSGGWTGKTGCGIHLRVVDAERGTLALWNRTEPDDGPWCFYFRWT